MDDRARLPLLDVRIASPCAASWVEMEGDDRARFCRRCEKNVYDLSSMTAAEARRFVAEREGACVRLFRRRDGTVMTSDCPVGARRRRLTKLAAAALTLGSAATALAMAPGDDTPAGDRHAAPDRTFWFDDDVEVVMGEMIPLPPDDEVEKENADDDARDDGAGDGARDEGERADSVPLL